MEDSTALLLFAFLACLLAPEEPEGDDTPRRGHRPYDLEPWNPQAVA